MSKEAMKLALKRAFVLGQDYWYQADHESYRQNKKADETLAKFRQLVDETCEALAKPDFWEGYLPEPVKPGEGASATVTITLPAQQEPVACAKVCDRVVGGKDPDDIHSDSQWAALTLAAEIRARSNT